MFEMRRFNRHRVRTVKRANLKLPERWEKYTTIGKVVSGTRFLPFKTPLKEEICRRSLSNRDWFTPAMLLEKEPNIKLIVDLTQTDRFYPGKYFDDHGVRHHKIICPGGGKSLPSRDIIQKFTQTINDFLASEDGLNKDSLIGVHCTHGLNRTGYLICKYMVEHGGISAKAAIEAFEEARGHKMERELYTNDILNKPLAVTTNIVLENTGPTFYEHLGESREHREDDREHFRNYRDLREDYKEHRGNYRELRQDFKEHRRNYRDLREDYKEHRGNYRELCQDYREHRRYEDRYSDDTNWRNHPDPRTYNWEEIGYNYASSSNRPRGNSSRIYRVSCLYTRRAHHKE